MRRTFGWVSGKDSESFRVCWRRSQGSPGERGCRVHRRGFGMLYKRLRRRRKWPPTPVFLPGKSHG